MSAKANFISPKFEINKNVECTIIDNTHEAIAPEVDAKLSKVRITNSDAKLKISSKNWLKKFGLKSNGLNSISLYPKLGFPRVEDFNKALQKPIQSKYGDKLFPRHFREDGVTFNIVAKKEKILDAQKQLKDAVDLYKQRLQWLKTESRRIFGVVEEHVVTIIIDINNKIPREFDQFICALERLLNEQIRYCLKFNLIRAQDTTHKFSSRCQTVTKDSISAGIDWLWEIDKTASVNTANLVEAVIRANNDPENEAIYLITEANSSDGSREVLRNKIHQFKIPFHIVAYNCVDDGLLAYYRDLTQITGARLHTYVFDMSLDAYEAPPVYSVGAGASLIHRRLVYGNSRGGISTRQDCMEIFQELEEAKQLLGQVESIIDKIPDSQQYENNDLDDGGVNEFLERRQPEKQQLQQCHQTQEEYMTSEEWLKRFGLNSRKLDFYDVLAGVCFRHCDGVVDVLEPPNEDEIDLMEKQNAKHHEKLINARYCDKFAHVLWKDGSLVHVQISSDVHRLYHQRMQLCLSAIQRRIDWLRQGSRELFGTISEQNICLVVDTSASMAPQIDFVKQKLYCLCQEQLRHKQKINMVAFNTKVIPWRDRLIDVTETNMESAWRWAENLNCQGSTNTLAALQFALKDRSTQGIYFLTDGRPDQPPQTVLAQMRLMQQNRVPVHCISFNCADNEANRFLWDLARESGGRFHYFNETAGDEAGDNNDGDNDEVAVIQAWESEDIRVLKAEYTRGTEYLEKITKLRDECHQLAWKKEIDLKRRGEHQEKRLPRFNTSMGGCGGSNAIRNRKKTGRQKIRARNTMKRELERRKPDATDKRIWEGNIDLLEFDQPRSEPEAYVSFLQNFIGCQDLNDDWVMPETQSILDRQSERYKKIIEDEEKEARRQKGAETKRKSHRDLSLQQWLKIYGLSPQHMTILDALAPTIVNVKPQYVPILDRHVVSRVYTDILPVSHVVTKTSPRKGVQAVPEVRLVNPLAVDLPKYQRELSTLLNKYHIKLVELVKSNLCPVEDNEKLDEFNKLVAEHGLESLEVKQWVMDEFAAADWPEHEDDLELLFREIKMGQKYMLQAEELLNHRNERRKPDIRSSVNFQHKDKASSKSKTSDSRSKVSSHPSSKTAQSSKTGSSKKKEKSKNDNDSEVSVQVSDRVGGDKDDAEDKETRQKDSPGSDKPDDSEKE